MERETGIEPAQSAWKAEVLPLNYSRAGTSARLLVELPADWWREVDSNHRRRKPADLQSAPVGRLGIPPVATPETSKQPAILTWRASHVNARSLRPGSPHATRIALGLALESAIRVDLMGGGDGDAKPMRNRDSPALQRARSPRPARHPKDDARPVSPNPSLPRLNVGDRTTGGGRSGLAGPAGHRGHRPPR